MGGIGVGGKEWGSGVTSHTYPEKRPKIDSIIKSFIHGWSRGDPMDSRSHFAYTHIWTQLPRNENRQ